MAFDYGSVIAAGINTFGGLAANQINAERAASDMATYLNLVKKQRDWQKEDQQWTEDYAKRLMGYEYENFGSPSAQMAAYKKAGLNPFLASQGGLVGSGNTVKPSAAPQSSRVGVSPFERTPLSNPFEGAADKIFGASSLKSQRIAALSDMAKSIPSLVKGVGEDTAKRVLSSLYGNDVSTQLIDAYINNELVSQRIANERSQLELDLRNTFGPDKEQLVISHLSGEVDKLQEECLSLRKGRELTDKEIDELVTRSARNVAEKAHLYADSATIDKLRDALYYEAKFKADSAHSQSQIDSFNMQDRRATFVSESPERELKRLEGTPDNELSPSQRIYKKASQFWKRLGKVVKNVSPLSP